MMFTLWKKDFMKYILKDQSLLMYITIQKKFEKYLDTYWVTETTQSENIS